MTEQRRGNMPKVSVPLEQRFWTFVRAGDSSECWIWSGAKNHGYGTIRDGRKTRRAHRVSFERHKGPIPEGMVVMHACDSPACVNPSHLGLGTLAENTADMIRKGRHLEAAQNTAERQRAKPTCKRGHLFSEVGILWREGGTVRRCRECARQQSARNNERVRGKLAA